MISGISSSLSSLDATEMRKQMFQKLDTNSDGSISKDELTAAVPQDGKGPSVDTILSQADTNEDGSIDASENDAFLQKMESSRHHGPPGPPPPGPPPGTSSASDISDLAQSLFKSSDSDSDGKISKDELTSVLSQTDSSIDVESLFTLADTDEDGSISASELETTMKTLQEQMQANWALLQAAGASMLETVTGYSQSGTTTSESKTSSFSAVA